MTISTFEKYIKLMAEHGVKRVRFEDGSEIRMKPDVPDKPEVSHVPLADIFDDKPEPTNEEYMFMASGVHPINIREAKNA